MEEKQDINTNFPFRKTFWAAGHQKHHQCKEHKRQPPLSQFAQFLDCHWPCLTCSLQPPKLTARGAELAGSQISVLGTWTVGLAFPQTLGRSVFPCPQTVPAHSKLLPVPKAWAWHAVMGKRAWEGLAMPPQKLPLGVQWNRRCFYFYFSDSL